jgi:hypothetical protein
MKKKIRKLAKDKFIGMTFMKIPKSQILVPGQPK